MKGFEYMIIYNHGFERIDYTFIISWIIIVSYVRQ